jgi:hypothetical protein
MEGKVMGRGTGEEKEELRKGKNARESDGVRCTGEEKWS